MDTHAYHSTTHIIILREKIQSVEWIISKSIRDHKNWPQSIGWSNQNIYIQLKKRKPVSGVLWNRRREFCKNWHNYIKDARMDIGQVKNRLTQRRWISSRKRSLCGGNKKPVSSTKRSNLSIGRCFCMVPRARKLKLWKQQKKRVVTNWERTKRRLNVIWRKKKSCTPNIYHTHSQSIL